MDARSTAGIVDGAKADDDKQGDDDMSNLPLDVVLKQTTTGHVDLAWVGAHEVVLEADLGTGALIVSCFDHENGERVFEGTYPYIGVARRKFNDARRIAWRRGA